MDKHICELEIVIGHSGYFYARCIIEDCDIELTSEQITTRLNATERLSKDDVRRALDGPFFLGAKLTRVLKAYADTRDGK